MKSKKILKLIFLTLILVFIFGIYTFSIANISRETPLEKHSPPNFINTMQPDDNYEENDYYYEAYDLSYDEDTWLSYINGLGIQADDDWYEIYVDYGFERLLVTLSFTDSEGGIDIEVYDYSLTFIDGKYSNTDNEYIDVVLPSSGTYYLYIFGADAGNEYDLWWDDIPIDDIYEPNDYYYEAYDLSYDEDTWLSYINGQGIQADDDWYEIYVDYGFERLLVTLSFTDSEGNINIEVYDYSLTFIDGEYSNTDNEYIDVVLPSYGTYFLYIYGDEAGNEYDLWWNDIVPDDNYEENDYYYEAYDLSSYNNIWLDSIDGSGLQYDDDWYEIFIDRGYEHLIVDLTFSHSDGDINLAVHDHIGSFIISSTTSTDNENIDTILPSIGTYYIKVYGDNSGNIYDLKWDEQPQGIPGYNFYILLGIISTISIISIIKILKKNQCSIKSYK